jgi:predicted transcriptional regulator
MEATTTRRRRTVQPITKAWNQAKKLDVSEKLQLITMLAESMRNANKQELNDALRPYTMEEIYAMIDKSERDIAEGRVYDFDEAMDELEKELAAEDRELEMVEAV